MEEVMGKSVVHKIFGRGIIILADARYFTVRFDQAIGDKQFLFPSAFDSILTFEDSALQEGAMEAVAQARQSRQQYSTKIAIRCKQEAMMQMRKKAVRKTTVRKSTEKK